MCVYMQFVSTSVEPTCCIMFNANALWEHESAFRSLFKVDLPTFSKSTSRTYTTTLVRRRQMRINKAERSRRAIFMLLLHANSI